MNLLILLFLIQAYQNPFCKDSGFELSPDSDAIGYGVLTELHCPFYGPDPNKTGCIELYGFPPDAGACPYIPPNWRQIDGEFIAALKD